jgi:hypothetical protein
VFSEFSQQKVLRRIDLSGKIDVDKVEARLHDGVLEVSATKLPGKTTKRTHPLRAARGAARGRADTRKVNPSVRTRNRPDA